MKLSVVLWLAATLNLSAASYAQNVSINVKNASLKDVFKLITKQSGYNILYNSEMLNETNLVTLNIKNMPFEEALAKCFLNQPVTYMVNANNLVVVKRAINKPGMEAVKADVVVTGTVLDNTGKPLPGVTVRLKGSTLNVTTNNEGKYSIRLPDGSGTLMFSYIGFGSREIPVGNKTLINLTLTEESANLEEMVVVGYGSRKKSDLTGAVSSVSEKALRDIPAGNIATALQGTAAGVEVMKSGGNSHPGASPAIRIRGERSLSVSGDPLIILDGIPYNGSLTDINPDDIVSAQILKDASSTAIYGSRGANGVILISSRRGKSGEPIVSYNAYAGFNKVIGEYDVMNAAEFVEFKKWAKLNGSSAGSYTGIDDPKLLGDAFTDADEFTAYNAGGDVNWQKLLYKTALNTNHQIGVSGGTEKTQYDVSLGYYNAAGIYDQQGLTRYTAKLSVDQKLGKYLKIGLNSLNSYTLNNGLNINPISQVLQASPFAGPRKADGTLNTYLPGGNKQVWNPLTDFEPGAVVDDKKRTATFTTVYLDADLTHGFKYRLNAGLQLSPETQGRFYSSNTTHQLGDKNYGYNYNSTGYNYTVENILTYDKLIGKDHAFNFTGLYSIQESQTENNSVTYRDILADYLQYHKPNYASSVSADGDYQKWDILSYMARLNYTFKDKYLLTLTVRSDGSSRLAEGNKWHTFPSAAFGWNIGKEAFLADSKAVSALKLRASYGTVGTTSIGVNETLGGLSLINYNFGGTNVQGTYPTSAANTTLTWENTSSLNLGVDYGFFNNRINGSVEWYKQYTSDILLNQSLPKTSGYNSIRNNIGKTENQGMEFNLSSINFSGNEKRTFGWTTTLNVFFNRSKITELSSGATQDINNNWFVGSPNGSIYDYKRLGIWQNTPEDIALATKYGLTVTGTTSVIGTVKVADLNGDNKINELDKTILGARQPKFEGGITNRFTYKNFDFTVVAYFKSGGLLKSGIHGSFANSFQAGYNNLNVDYWTPENGGNFWPKPNSSLQFPAYLSTLDTYNASYLKIRTLTLGYTLPQNSLKSIGLKSARFYTTASNPFTFLSEYKSKFGGLDPETNGNVDVNTPATWSMLFGLNISF